MAKSKKRKHGSGKPCAYTNRVGKYELSEALTNKLSSAELVELKRELSVTIDTAVKEAEKKATEEAYRRQFAVMIRVLRDRFGFGKKRLRRLWDSCLDYIHDIDEGLITTQEMIDTLEHEDKIVITWCVRYKEQ